MNLSERNSLKNSRNKMNMHKQTKILAMTEKY